MYTICLGLTYFALGSIPSVHFAEIVSFCLIIFPIWVFEHLNPALYFLELTLLLWSLVTFIFCSIVSTFTFGDDLIFLACQGVIGPSKGLFGSLAGLADTGRALGGLADAGRALGELADACRALRELADAGRALGELADAGRALGGLADAGRVPGELADAEGSLKGLVVDVSSSNAMVDVMQACQILCKSKKNCQ